MVHDIARRKRPKISPKDLKKSSQVRREARGAPIKIAGTREVTDTGYRVPGYAGKNYELFYEVMLAGSASAFLLHEKKDRSVSIVGGQGFVTIKRDDDAQKTRRVISGDCLTFERGTTYRLSTTSTEQLEFFVSQSAKYEAALQVVEPTDAPRQATEGEMVEPTLDERLGTVVAKPASRQRRSKAAQQQRAQYRRSAQIEDTFKVIPEDQTSKDPTRAGALTGINAQPTGGRFSDEGAG